MAPKKQSNAKTAPKAAHSKSAALSPKPQAKQGIHPLPLSFHTRGKSAGRLEGQGGGRGGKVG